MLEFHECSLWTIQRRISAKVEGLALNNKQINASNVNLLLAASFILPSALTFALFLALFLICQTGLLTAINRFRVFLVPNRIGRPTDAAGMDAGWTCIKRDGCGWIY